MRCNRRRAKLWASGVHLFAVFVAHAIVPQLAGVQAFQLWPNKLTRALRGGGGGNRQDANIFATTSNTSNRHRQQADSTTTSTTSTTTQMPPIELHFEINPDDLEQQQQLQANHHHQEINDLGQLEEQQPANGTLILEDLVNQFEREFSLKRTSPLNRNRNRNQQRQDQADSTDRTDDLQLFESAGTLADEVSSNKSPAEPNLQTISSADFYHSGNRSAQYTMSEPAAIELTNTTRVSSESSVVETSIGTASQEETTTRSGQSDSLVDTPYPPNLDPDRHIQYDTFAGTISNTATISVDSTEQQSAGTLSGRQQQQVDDYNRFDAASGRPNKTAGPGTHVWDQSTSSEPELVALRNTSTPVGHETSTMNSIGQLRQISSPLLIVSAAKNVSVSTSAPPITTTTTTSPALNSSSAQPAAPGKVLDPQDTNQLAAVMRSLGGQSQAQARSMSGMSSRLPQHSKAPYASYSLFSHRSDPNHKLSSSTTTAPDQNSSSSSNIGNSRVGGDMKLSQHSGNQELGTSDTSLNGSPVSQTSGSKSPGDKVDSFNRPNGSELVDSINRISSHLVSETSRDAVESAGGGLKATTNTTTATSTTTTNSTTSTTTTTTPSPMTLMYQLQAYLNGGGNNSSNLNLNFPGRNEQRDELERVASKLAPANELIELDPLPYDSQDRQQQPSGGTGNSGVLSERFYSGSNREGNRGQQLHQQQQSSRRPVSRNDRYPSPADELELNPLGINRLGSSPGLDLYQNADADDRVANDMGQNHQHRHHRPHIQDGGFISVRNHDSSRNHVVVSPLNGDSSNFNHDDELTNEHDHDSPVAPIVHRKTIETLSNQIKNSDNSLLLAAAPSSNTLAVHQHKERSPAQPQPQVMTVPLNRGIGEPGGTFAASLINVTAPMSLPLSASEAMEAAMNSLNKQQGHHHEPGSQTMGTGGTGHRQHNHHHYHNQQQQQQQHLSPHRSSYYVIQPPSIGAHDSIYSRPMNQFRPTTQAPHPSHPGDRGESGPSTLSAAERGHYGSSSSSPSNSMGSTSTLSASQLASGFRSPLSHYPDRAQTSMMGSGWPFGHATNIPTPASYLTGLETATLGSSSLAPPPSTTTSASTSTSASTNNLASSSSSSSMSKFASSTPATPSGGLNRDNISNNNNNGNSGGGGGRPQTSANKPNATGIGAPLAPPATTNGFITGSVVNTTLQPSQIDLIGAATGGSGGGGSGSVSPPGNPGSISSQVVAGSHQQPGASQAAAAGPPGASKRVFNLTRVEHISAECSNDLIRTIIIFNGTFKGIIYSSGYVRDPNCLYINGTGKTRYDFSIRLNQCGTLGRQEIHSPSGPDEVRRRDQVMWNSLSIQYNPIIEQEWDEHFKVSCEYGSDFWKTISFSPFNVETNTGSPVVFTVDPPQCQMEILKGHGMVGPRQEAISGPVTVGDPLTLLIHMKSEKAGYDILVKNCIAHNGGQQKMQLIDSNGCVVNERFISPFRGTYNDNDLKHVTLYSYLKAFRFTGSPVLYLECEVHMCQSACPPQMCYWRRLSKRSLGHSSNETTILPAGGREADNYTTWPEEGANFDEDDDGHEHIINRARLSSLGHSSTTTTTEASSTTLTSKRPAGRYKRTGKRLESMDHKAESQTSTTTTARPAAAGENLSDKISLFQALEVRQERFPDPATAATSLSPYRTYNSNNDKLSDGLYDASGAAGGLAAINQLMCYQRVEIFAFLFTVASILLAAVSVTVGCYCRASSLKRQQQQQLAGTTATTASMSHHHRHRCTDSDATKLRYALQQQKLPRAAHTLASTLAGLTNSNINSANLCYSPISSASSSASSSSSLASPGSTAGNSAKSFSHCSPSVYSNLVSSSASSNTDTRPQVYGHLRPVASSLLAASNKSDKANYQARNGSQPAPPIDSLGAFLSQHQQAQFAMSCNAATSNERLLAKSAKSARRS